MENTQPVPTIIMTEKNGFFNKLTGLLRRPKRQTAKLHRYRSSMAKQAA